MGLQMGLATDTTIGTGIMGIGYNTSEANLLTGNGTIYPNLPYAMADAGLIKSTAYSLWLNDLRTYRRQCRRRDTANYEQKPPRDPSSSAALIPRSTKVNWSLSTSTPTP